MRYCAEFTSANWNNGFGSKSKTLGDSTHFRTAARQSQLLMLGATVPSTQAQFCRVFVVMFRVVVLAAARLTVLTSAHWRPLALRLLAPRGTGPSPFPHQKEKAQKARFPSCTETRSHHGLISARRVQLLTTSQFGPPRDPPSPPRLF